MTPLECLRYLYAGALEKKPTEAQVHRALDAVVKATGLTPIGEWPESMVDWPEQENPPHWIATRVVAGTALVLSGQGKAAWCQVSSCKPIDEKACEQALQRHLKGVWREIMQDSYEIA